MSNISAGIKSPERPLPTDFDEFIPWACRQLMLDRLPLMVKSSQERMPGAKPPKSKTPAAEAPTIVDQQTMGKIGSDFEKSLSTLSIFKDGDMININTTYDNNDALVQLKFCKNSSIPQDLMQVIALALPFHKQLVSVTIDSGLTNIVVYELKKWLPISGITEVCLDGTFIEGANYDILLDQPHLKNFSLARCKINDDVVKNITDKISFPDGPSLKSLSALNLSSNMITDVGAKYIAHILRGNRKLSYLNISDNGITDEGAAYILDHLKVFVLTKEEVYDAKNKRMCYLRTRNDIITQVILAHKQEELDRKDKRLSKAPKLVKKKDRSAMDLLEKAENAVMERIGIFENPYSKEATKMIDGKLHSLGNNVLCYINFAYNHLTYLSVTKILDVLNEQNQLQRRPRGLISIRVDGNKLPIYCKEYSEIEDILGQAITRQYTVSSFKKKKG